MPVAASANAAAARNARKKRKEKLNEEARQKLRLKRERSGLCDEFEIQGDGLNLGGATFGTVPRASSVRHYSLTRSNTGSTIFAADGLHGGDPLSTISYYCEEIATSQKFNMFIIGAILVAGILVGLQTYDALENDPIVSMIDTAVLGIFCLEVALKILAENRKPWLYFIGNDARWNNFDFFIVFMSLPIWNWGNSISLLRLMRLMRVVKIIKKVPQLYMIIMGLVGGIKAIVYILILMFIIFYLYAIVGFMLFVPNDRFHFGNLFRGLVSLWRIATFEDWTDVFYINYYGCDSSYDSGFYTNDEKQADNVAFFHCSAGDSYSMGFVAVLYFVSFVFISALVMLSLFVGAVTMSMTESMEQLKAEKEMMQREKLMERAREKARMKSSRNLSSLDDGESELSSPRGPPRRTTSIEGFKGMVSKIGQRASLISRLGNKEATSPKHPPLPSHLLNKGKLGAPGQKDGNSMENTDETPQESKRGLLNMGSALFKQSASNFLAGTQRKLIVQNENGETVEVDGPDMDDEELSKLRGLIHAAIGGDVSGFGGDQNPFDHFKSYGPLKRFYAHLAHYCHVLTEHMWFNNFITFVIVIAGALVGLSTFEITSPELLQAMSILDTTVMVIFCAEVILKTMAAKFKPWQYFFKHHKINLWNTFDYLVVAGSFLPGSGSFLTLLRLLRLLRVLKLLRALPELQVIVVALINGLGSISYIAVILFLVFYLFAIVGMILFEGNDPYHFGTLHISLYTLFRCATLEDWTDVMYTNMFGCDKFGYIGMEEFCVAPDAKGSVATFYFITFTLIGGLVLMTLFIGVVTTSMEEASQEQRDQIELQNQVIQLQADLGLPDSMIKVYKEIFGLIDIDSGGTIDEEELAIGFIAVGEMFSKEEIKEMVAQVDEDNSGEIDIAEFISFMQIFTEKARFFATDEGQRARNVAKLEQDVAQNVAHLESFAANASVKVARRGFSVMEPESQRNKRLADLGLEEFDSLEELHFEQPVPKRNSAAVHPF